MKQSVTVGAQLLWGGRYGCNNGRYGCTIVMSYIEINKAVSQWLLTFNLCVSVTWPLTCAFHIPCTHTPEIIDMHRGVCDNDATWWHKSRSTLTQVMACCLTAPSHYLNQCWLIISEVQWHSSQGTFIIDTSPSCVTCCWPEQTVEQTVELEAIQDSTTFMWHHCDGEQVMITMKLITSAPAYLAVKSQNPNMDKWCGMKLVIHSQTHTVAPLKFENG